MSAIPLDRGWRIGLNDVGCGVSDSKTTSGIVSWFRRYEPLIPWLTFLSLTLGGILHFALLDLPAARTTEQLVRQSEKNQALIDQKLLEARASTSALIQNVEGVRAEVDLARTTIDQLRDPTKKETDRLHLEHLRSENAKLIDELVDSLRPNFRVDLLPGATWRDMSAEFEFTLTNAGSRPIIVETPVVHLTINSNSDSQVPPPDPSKATIDTCSAGLISPGETLHCAVTFQVTSPLTGVRSLACIAHFVARTELPRESGTWHSLRSSYPDGYLESKLTKRTSFRTEFFRSDR